MPHKRTVCWATTPGFLLWLMVLSPWGVGDCSPARAAKPPDPGIQVLSSGSGTVTLELAEKPEGFVCTGWEDLDRILVDGSEVPHDIRPGGGAAVIALFSDLEDGRHKATNAASLNRSFEVEAPEEEWGRFAYEPEVLHRYRLLSASVVLGNRSAFETEEQVEMALEMRF